MPFGRVELIIDDAKALHEQLEAVTGERVSALEGIGEMLREAEGEAAEARLYDDRGLGIDSEPVMVKERRGSDLERSRAAGMEFGL